MLRILSCPVYLRSQIALTFSTDVLGVLVSFSSCLFLVISDERIAYVE